MEENTLPEGTKVRVGTHTLTLSHYAGYNEPGEMTWISRTIHYLELEKVRKMLLAKGIPSQYIDGQDADENTGNILVASNPEVNARLLADRGEEDWMAHLTKWGLWNLHHEALECGYRIRVANGRTFDLEYQAGLPKYSQPPNGLKTFTDDPDGRNACRALADGLRARTRAAEKRMSDEKPRQSDLD